MKNNRQNPIYSSTEDKLNRGHFVDYIVNIIKNAPVKNKAFTISINGKWGEGKTSVKNLIIEKLLYLKKTASLIIMDFNCKEFEGQTELNKVFLTRFMDTMKNKKRRRGILNFIFNKYSFYTLIFLIIFAGSLYPNIFVRFSSLVLTFLFIFRTQLRKVTLASIMDVISRFYIKVDVIYKILYYDPITEHGAENSKLINYIEKKCLYNKIIVFIDTFDSLDEKRLKMLMQLVNSKLDLPKVVFVLFYDKSIMENCLTTNVYSGSEFMEKFIDIQLDLPLITDDILLNFLRNELQEKYNINLKYLNEFKYIKNYFTYLSKIYSFLDNFDLNFTLMVNNFKHNNFIFNKKDFFLLEILRFFENDVYRIIRKGKRILTKHNLKINTDKETFWPKIVENIKNNSEENIKELLFSLFPYLPIQLNIDNEGKYYVYDENMLILNKGVGYFDYFDYYFIYEMNEIVISEENFNILRKYLGNNEEFITQFKQIFSIMEDNNIHMYTESVLRKIFKRIAEPELLNDVAEPSERQKEFLKNLIWLYIYSNRNSTSKEHLISILLEYCKKTSFDNLLENLTLILNEFDYFNYFYVLEILNVVKFNLIEIICENNQIQKEKYLLVINETIFKYINFLFDNNNILEYLSRNSFNSRLQIHHIINFIKDKNLNKNNINYVLDNKFVDYLKSCNFKKFKDSVVGNYFNLLYLFVEYSIKKKIINGDLYLFLDVESLYPFTVDELVDIFKKNNVSKKDKVFRLLLLSKAEG